MLDGGAERSVRSSGLTSCPTEAPRVRPMRHGLWLPPALAVLIALPAGTRHSAQEKLPQGRDSFFVAKVAPVLRERCVECHNGKKSRGGLDLTTRASTLTGGDKGPVIVPGDAGKSLLLRMVA